MANQSHLRALAAVSALAVALVPSLTGPGAVAQGTQTVQSISASDKAEGAKANPDMIAQYGGAVTGPQADYIASIGKNIAVQSGLSGARGDFTVTLLNSSVNNAFAIPGGYIYTTRQLVALMNNEAELAGVLGHETGHVAARHAAKRQSAATRNNVIGVLGAVLTGVLLGNSQLGQYVENGLLQGSQLLTLKYSRGQESEADALGVSYLKKAGYDPRAMSTVLQSLANETALESKLMGVSGTVPTWASTHPDPASRVAATAALAGANAGGITNRDIFLSRISGLIYGDDPAQGVAEGRVFTHPGLRLRFEAPTGYYLMNGTTAVSIGGQGGKGEFSSGKFSGDLDGYVRAVYAGLTDQGQAAIDPGTISHTTINGIPAAVASARVNASSGPVDVRVVAYQWGVSEAYHFVTIVPAGSGDPFAGMVQSLRRITAAEAAAVKPRHLTAVTVKRGDTVQSLAAKMAYSDAPLDRFLVLNALSANSVLAPGQKVKLVTY